jgi:hypothetical protein
VIGTWLSCFMIVGVLDCRIEQEPRQIWTIVLPTLSPAPANRRVRARLQRVQRRRDMSWRRLFLK